VILKILRLEELKCLPMKLQAYVTLFTARFPDCLYFENIDGVNIIRDGNRYSVYNKAKGYYKKYKHRYDAIIDEINARPFLTPRFVKKKDNNWH
jgi:hypothetical protein